MDLSIREDTICAIATPVGEGAIGIIKISGPEARAIARKLFVPHRGSGALKSHRLTYGWIRDPATEERVDEVLLSFMAAPHTYTREDVVEINVHSGFAVLSRVLELVMEAGARLAQPGEFTRRAFLSGRLDLSQAEAVIDLIRSRSEQSLLLAGRHLGGEFRESVHRWRECLLQLQSELEASIDFTEDLEEDIADPVRLCERLKTEVLSPLLQALGRHTGGRVLREGLTLVLVGKPNVGKSSLLNALLGRDRAIVTPHPGTTRDVIEDSFTLFGILVRILDTAGIRHEPDAIESLGIERAIRSVEEADVALWLIDRSRPLSEEDDAVFSKIGSTPRVVLLNKTDLPSAVTEQEVKERFGDTAPILQLSALRAPDVESLRGFLTERFFKAPLEACRSSIVPNLRQKECLDRAVEALRRAEELLHSGGYGELLSLEFDSARRQLESILGLECDEAVLDRIFSQFCIGK